MFGAVCIVIVIILIILLYKFSHSDRIKRKKSEKSLSLSAGVFDSAAKTALTELVKVTSPTAGDYFRRGNIIQHNILENNFNTNDHDAIKNVFKDYTDTLTTLRGHVFEFENIEGNDRDLNPAFIINQIDNFGRAIPDFDHLRADDELVRAVMNFNDVTINTLPEVKKEVIRDRIQKAAENSTCRQEIINKYLNNSTVYTNDNQNVHDPKVNSDLKTTLKKLKSTYLKSNINNSQKSFDEAQDYITHTYATLHDVKKVDDALNILKKMKTGDLISTFNETEDQIFSYVWERSNLAKNAENANLMREAIVNSLADGIHNESQVCINGRCSRVLNSLALLDYDKDVSAGALTFEAYKNQIFQETKEIVNQEIDRAKNSTNADLRKVGLAYETGDESGLPDVEKQFKSEVKTAIDNNISQYKDKFTNDELSDIKEQNYIIGTI